MRKLMTLAALTACSCSGLLAQELPAVCSPTYYAQILRVVNWGFYQVGKPHSVEYEMETAKLADKFESVSCKRIGVGDLTLVHLVLTNAGGVKYEIETGANSLPAHVVTQEENVLAASKAAASSAKRLANEQPQVTALLGRTFVLERKTEGLPAGQVFTIKAAAYDASGRWKVSMLSGSQVLTYNLYFQELSEAISASVSPRDFLKLSPADRKAVRTQLWQYGMSEDILFVLRGYPDTRNDYDGADQIVYRGHSYTEIFYFSRAGLLTNHTLLED